MNLNSALRERERVELSCVSSDLSKSTVSYVTGDAAPFIHDSRTEEQSADTLFVLDSELPSLIPGKRSDNQLTPLRSPSNTPKNVEDKKSSSVVTSSRSVLFNAMHLAFFTRTPGEIHVNRRCCCFSSSMDGYFCEWAMGCGSGHHTETASDAPVVSAATSARIGITCFLTPLCWCYVGLSRADRLVQLCSSCLSKTCLRNCALVFSAGNDRNAQHFGQ